MTQHLIFSVVTVFLLVASAQGQNSDGFKCPKISDHFFPCTCTGGGEKGIYVACENTNLASLAIGLANVRLPIEELHLYKVNIKELYGDVFKYALIYRLIIEEVPLVKIDKEVFVPLKDTLTHLHLRNAYKTDGLPVDAFGPLKKLKVLEVQGCNVTKVTPDVVPAIPNLEEFRLNFCGIKSIGASALGNLRKLVRIDFHHNEISNIPRNAFNNKREVRVLDLSYNNFTKIESQYFQGLNKMTWCNMSNNAIDKFGRNPFGRSTAIGLLNLRHNKLKKIADSTFRTTRMMRRLYLSDNQITQIGRKAFSSMRRIGTVELTRNNLTKVDAYLFDGLEHCEFIELAENQITEIEKYAFRDLFLVSINISHNQISKFANNSFVNTVNITTLDLSHNNISEMAREVFPGDNSYMTIFRLDYNNITDLSHISLHFSGIKVLNATYNRIETIPYRVFPKLYELHTVDLSHNQLKTFKPNNFNNLFSIRSINMSYNALEEIIPGAFGTIPTVLELDLSHNNLTKIARGALTNLASLRFLYLGHNRLTKVIRISQALNYLHMNNNNISTLDPGKEWPQMNALLYLNLDGNKLGNNIVGDTFKHLNSLQTLSLNNNSISNPPWQALGQLQTLQYLYLEHNNITNLTRNAFGNLPVVFEIRLAHNGLRNISKQSFQGLLQLLTLNLSSNALYHIPNDAFRGLVSLRSLDLSHNFLKRVDNETNGLFDDLLSVRSLNLSHNEFNVVSKKMFPYHRYIPYNVQRVDLSYNQIPVLTKNLLIGLQKVKYLNFSNNILNEIRPSVFGNLTKLEVLDISHNDLEALGQYVLGRNRSLKEIYMQNNLLISIPSAVIMSNENITHVDVRNNQLYHYYEEFVDKVVNGTTVKYQGNPVQCDCLMRPIRRWLSTWLGSEVWQDIVCDKPAGLHNRSLPFITEKELDCHDFKALQKDEDDIKYQITPDIQFRMMEKKMHKLNVQWYVTTREDVGGFLISVRNTTSGELKASQSLSYIHRQQRFPEIKRGLYTVCVTALDSEKKPRPMQSSQCRRVFVSSAWSVMKPSSTLLLSLYGILALFLCIFR